MPAWKRIRSLILRCSIRYTRISMKKSRPKSEKERPKFARMGHRKRGRRTREIIDDHVGDFSNFVLLGTTGKASSFQDRVAPGSTASQSPSTELLARQERVLFDMVKKFVYHGMTYPNLGSAWPCAPLLASKPGPAQFQFTVDLLPVNRFTGKHKYPMPNIK